MFSSYAWIPILTILYILSITLGSKSPSSLSTINCSTLNSFKHSISKNPLQLIRLLLAVGVGWPHDRKVDESMRENRGAISRPPSAICQPDNEFN
jgi:hypothetical protein